MSTLPLFHGLFDGLFDDAALFPPGNAAMPAALTGHADYRRQWYSRLVAAFVCPAARLAELDGVLAAAGSQSMELSVTVPGGLPALAGALAMIDQHRRLAVRAVELPVPAAELTGALEELGRTAQRGVEVFVEVRAAEVTSAASTALHQARLGLKLRTGGTTAAAFPGVDALAGAIETAVAAGVRFKCTAGLHHAVRHDDPATGLTHHGFLNILLAVQAAQNGSGETSELLASRDGVELAERARVLSPAEVGALRGQFASIGSCSILEPLTDLSSLKLVSAA